MDNFAGGQMDFEELEKKWLSGEKFIYKGDHVKIVEMEIFFDDENKIFFNLDNGKTIFLRKSKKKS